MNLTEQLGFANLEIGTLKRALIDAQAATKSAERTTKLVQRQLDQANNALDEAHDGYTTQLEDLAATTDAEAAALRKAHGLTVTDNANLAADNAQLRRTIVEQEDRINDMAQRCVGFLGLRKARRHGIIVE